MTIIYFKKEKTFNDIENTNIIHCESEKNGKVNPIYNFFHQKIPVETYCVR